MTVLHAPTEEDVQVARSAFSLLHAAVSAAGPSSVPASSAKSRGGSSDSLQMLRWCVGSIQGVADLLLRHLQQRRRCQLLQEQGVWEEVADSVASSCQVYVEQFLPQMLQIHTVESALFGRWREKQQQQQSSVEEEKTFEEMVDLARQLQGIELNFIDRLLETDLKAAPCCVSALKDILQRHVAQVCDEAVAEGESRSFLILEMVLSVLRTRAPVLLLAVSTAAAALAGEGIAAVQDVMGSAAAAVDGFAALCQLRPMIHRLTLELYRRLSLRQASEEAAASVVTVQAEAFVKKEGKRLSGPRAARCMQCCLAVIECWLECTSTFSVEAVTTEMKATCSQHQAQQARSKELLGRLVLLWNEEDSLLLRQFLVLPPHEHMEDSGFPGVSTAESRKFTFNPAVYVQVLQTAIWLCCRVPRHLKVFLPLCLDLASQLREALSRAKVREDPSVVTDTAFSCQGSQENAGSSGTKDQGPCGIHCVVGEASRIGGETLLTSLLQALQDEGLRLLGSPLCRAHAAVALLEATGRRESLRVLQREAQGRFSAMWCRPPHCAKDTNPLQGGDTGLSSFIPTQPATLLDIQKRNAEGGTDASPALHLGGATGTAGGQEVSSNVSSLTEVAQPIPANANRNALSPETAAAPLEQAAAFATESTLQVWRIQRQENGMWFREPREVDATALVLQVASDEQLTSLLLNGLHKKTNQSASRADLSKSHAALTAEALLAEASAQLQKSQGGGNRGDFENLIFRENADLPSVFSQQSAELELATNNPLPLETEDGLSSADTVASSREAFMLLLSQQIASVEAGGTMFAGGSLPVSVVGSATFADRCVFLQLEEGASLAVRSLSGAGSANLHGREICVSATHSASSSPLPTHGRNFARRPSSTSLQFYFRDLPLERLRTQLALCTDALFFLSANAVRVAQARSKLLSGLDLVNASSSSKACVDASCALTCLLAGRAPPSLLGWNFKVPEKPPARDSAEGLCCGEFCEAIEECLARVYTASSVADVSSRAAYCQLVARFLVSAPSLPPSIFEALFWLAEGSASPSSGTAAMSVFLASADGSPSGGGAALSIVERLSSRCRSARAGGRSNKDIANDRRLVVAVLSQLLRRKCWYIARRTAFVLLFHLCCCGTASSRRLFTKLFSSAKGLYQPPQSPWRKTIVRPFGRKKINAAPEQSQEAEDGVEDAVLQTLMAPCGVSMWQMPDAVLRCVSDAEDAKAVNSCGASPTGLSSEAVDTASLSGRNSDPLEVMASVVPLDERSGWGSVAAFGCSWVEVVVSLLLASSCGAPAFAAISASLSEVPRFPQAVAEYLVQTIERTAGAAAKLQASKAEAKGENTVLVAVPAVKANQQTGAPSTVGGRSAEGDESTSRTATTAAAANAAGAAVFDMQSGAFAAVCTRNPFLLHLFMRIASFAVEENAQQRMLQLLRQVLCIVGSVGEVIVTQIDDAGHPIYPQLLELQQPSHTIYLRSLVRQLASISETAEGSRSVSLSPLLHSAWSAFEKNGDFCIIAPLLPLLETSLCRIYLQRFLLSSEPLSLLFEIFGDLMKSRRGREEGKKGLERGDTERGISAEELLLLVYNLPCSGVAARRRQSAALDLCFEMTGAVSSSKNATEILPIAAIAAVCQRLAEDAETPLQPVFGRMFCLAAQHLVSLGEFLSGNVLRALLSREAWRDPVLWKGVGLAIAFLWPAQSEALLKQIMGLPQEPAKSLLQQLQQRFDIAAELSALLAHDAEARRDCPAYLRVLLGLEP